MAFYVEHDGERFDYPTLRKAMEYFSGCAQDETVGAPIRLIDTDGVTVVGIINWDGIT